MNKLFENSSPEFKRAFKAAKRAFFCAAIVAIFFQIVQWMIYSPWPIIQNLGWVTGVAGGISIFVFFVVFYIFMLP